MKPKRRGNNMAEKSKIGADIIIRPLQKDDYEGVYSLWQRTENMGITSADSKENIDKFIDYNPGLSFVALWGDTIVGSLLAGYDGRRGYLYHFAVDTRYREQKIGHALLEYTYEGLRKKGVQKCHIFIFKSNQLGKTIWQKLGFKLRTDLDIMSHDLI
jgi:ribosomal protein S18 acetylase RimI-like enzyme